MRETARNIWWRLRGERRRSFDARLARGEVGERIYCRHTRLGKCFLRYRPGDTRKSCWAQCLDCGTYVACNC